MNKFTRNLINLKKEDFDSYVKTGQIQVQPARLIPTLKTGHEMALTSVFLTTIKLVKEYRESIFKDLRLKRSGKIYYYTEVCFPSINESRIDGLIIVISKGRIADAAFFEMKSKNNGIDPKQIETYLKILTTLKVDKLITVSNEFVANPTLSPIKVKVPKKVSLFHFSWTYLMTKGQLLLFKNEANIKDEDQVNVMREALYYFNSPISGTSGYTRMKPEWKELSNNIRAQKPLKASDEYIHNAVLSWYEEEKDMALLMSRKLGVLVKSSPKGKDSLRNDVVKLIKDNYLKGTFSIKNSVSDINVIVEFERRMVSMSVKIIPPLNKGTVAKISWISRQLDRCKNKGEGVFTNIEKDIWIEADIKYARENLKIELSKLWELNELLSGKDIQAFYVVVNKEFSTKFASSKLFVELIERMILDFYEGIVQHMTNWNRPAPKLERK